MKSSKTQSDSMFKTQPAPGTSKLEGQSWKLADRRYAAKKQPFLHKFCATTAAENITGCICR